ncbi:unnamed protein product, partial [Ectocarpus sp. 12 AP-2014]
EADRRHGVSTTTRRCVLMWVKGTAVSRSPLSQLTLFSKRCTATRGDRMLEPGSTSGRTSTRRFWKRGQHEGGFCSTSDAWGGPWNHPATGSRRSCTSGFQSNVPTLLFRSSTPGEGLRSR